jgi:RNA polymerase sigma factor (sigma-70 family)
MEADGMDWLTTTQVLEDLRSSGRNPAWQKFEGHFREVIIRFARHAGLSASDAEDAAQETMLVFVKAFREGKYEREKGRLRDWLFGITKHVVFNLRQKRPLERLIADRTTGTSFWDMVKDDRGIEQSWCSEWRRMALGVCLEQARSQIDAKVFAAFELYAMKGLSVEEVAAKLEMSHNAIYIAKSRVLSRLRELEKQFE